MSTNVIRAAFTIYLENGTLVFDVLGSEPRDAQDGAVWLRATVAASFSGVGPLGLAGKCALAAEDIGKLAGDLADIARAEVGEAGRIRSWCSRDEEIELTFARAGNAGTVTGRVDIAGSAGVQGCMEISEAAMSRSDMERSADAVSAAYAAICAALAPEGQVASGDG